MSLYYSWVLGGLLQVQSTVNGHFISQNGDTGRDQRISERQIERHFNISSCKNGYNSATKIFRHN